MVLYFYYNFLKNYRLDCIRKQIPASKRKKKNKKEREREKKEIAEMAEFGSEQALLKSFLKDMYLNPVCQDMAIQNIQSTDNCQPSTY